MAEMLWWHRAGQKVVCVVDMTGRHPWWIGTRLTAGPEVYTIRSVTLCANGIVVLKLSEITGNKYDGGYDSRYFRPVRETSIESLRALLNPSPDTRRRVYEEIIEEAVDG